MRYIAIGTAPITIPIFTYRFPELRFGAPRRRATRGPRRGRAWPSLAVARHVAGSAPSQGLHYSIIIITIIVMPTFL